MKFIARALVLGGVGLTGLFYNSSSNSFADGNNLWRNYHFEPTLSKKEIKGDKKEEKKVELFDSDFEVKAYKTEKGDTLEMIAKKLGVVKGELEKLNTEREYLDKTLKVTLNRFLIYETSDPVKKEYDLIIIKNPSQKFKKPIQERKIKRIVIHSDNVSGQMGLYKYIVKSAKATGEIAINDSGELKGTHLKSGTQTHESMHYDILKNGDVHRLVEEENISFHAFMFQDKRKSETITPNYDGLGVSFSGLYGKELSKAQIEAGAKLVSGLLKKYKLPVSAVCQHLEITNSNDYKKCPGDGYFSLVKRVKELMK